MRALQAILEDLALAARGLAEAARRHAGGLVEGAHEVREIPEADLVRDVGFRPSTSIEDGIKHFVEWYRGYRRI